MYNVISYNNIFILVIIIHKQLIVTASLAIQKTEINKTISTDTANPEVLVSESTSGRMSVSGIAMDT